METTKSTDRIGIPKWVISGIMSFILSVLLYKYAVPKYFPNWIPNKCYSEYFINGVWEIQGADKEIIGTAEIKHNENSCTFFISGEFNVPINNQKNVKFNSLTSQISGNQIFFFYENNYGEKGICQGHFLNLKKKSSRIYFNYTDLIDMDYNSDPKGQLTLIKKE